MLTNTKILYEIRFDDDTVIPLKYQIDVDLYIQEIKKNNPDVQYEVTKVTIIETREIMK